MPTPCRVAMKSFPSSCHLLTFCLRVLLQFKSKVMKYNFLLPIFAMFRCAAFQLLFLPSGMFFHN